ncbi:MAG: HAMP domain-containing histidine kinase [Flavobacteriaceae bacterium]|nr:HAMP domain-containing histidine kinase [Flavobacteriaceae bacterium]
MSRRLFVFLVVLMSLSLVGIIFVQGYWIKTSVEDKEEQFTTTVYQILNQVVGKIEEREQKEYVAKYVRERERIGKPKSTNWNQIYYIDGTSDEIFLYKNTILKEDFGISASLFDNSLDDSLQIPNITFKETTKIYRGIQGPDKTITSLSPVEVIERVRDMSDLDKIAYKSFFAQQANRVPIHKRLKPEEVRLKIFNELDIRKMEIDFEFGVYSKDLPTKVRSRKFRKEESGLYKVPIFRDNEGVSRYELLVSFPEKKQFLLSSILGMAVLSVLFTLIIVVAYSSAIYQLIRQKQISEIKSDFINNMTHEFKTPIATISLALDAVRNPKIIGDQEKVERYLKMIKEENNRMHTQVENVLRISKLDKNQLDIVKDKVDVHHLIQEAVKHIDLIVQNRGGYVKMHLRAAKSDIMANDNHFTNVLINILDNAVKYSSEEPKIDVYTEQENKQILIKIKDQGAGMSKQVAKRVFEKFYREHTGNIHNVKGHGLGLAYVKKIIDDHHGQVYVESEKGKGSTFFIKLPLI